MPYKVVGINGKYRIKVHNKVLPPHYKSKGEAEKVKRYLYARESKGFRGKK